MAQFSRSLWLQSARWELRALPSLCFSRNLWYTNSLQAIFPFLMIAFMIISISLWSPWFSQPVCIFVPCWVDFPLCLNFISHFQYKIWVLFHNYTQVCFYMHKDFATTIMHELIEQFHNENMEKTRRANAQMIHIRHTYRTFSQSSSLHNQSSLWTFELLHTTLQQKDCTSASFPVTLWPYVNNKVIQTGMKW